MFGSLVFLAGCAPAVEFQYRSELVIDLSTWTGAETARLSTRMVARDGSVVTVRGGELPKGTDPSSPRTGLRIRMDDQGWRYRYEDPWKVVVLGSKGGAPVKSVAFAGNIWVPAVTRRPAGPGWVKD